MQHGSILQRFDPRVLALSFRRDIHKDRPVERRNTAVHVRFGIAWNERQRSFHRLARRRSEDSLQALDSQLCETLARVLVFPLALWRNADLFQGMDHALDKSIARLYRSALTTLPRLLGNLYFYVPLVGKTAASNSNLRCLS